MNIISNNDEYLKLVKDILENDNFKKIDEIEHHGITRMEHSVKVSYLSYKIAKKLGLHYKEVARGGLLHDFFMSDLERTSKDRFISCFVHPKYAAKNSKELFKVNDMEYDIIRTHMFPINIAVPKFLESWLVSLVDKFVGTKEFAYSYKFKLSYATNYLYLFIFLNILNITK